MSLKEQCLREVQSSIQIRRSNEPRLSLAVRNRDPLSVSILVHAGTTNDSTNGVTSPLLLTSVLREIQQALLHNFPCPMRIVLVLERQPMPKWQLLSIM